VYPPLFAIEVSPGEYNMSGTRNLVMVGFMDRANTI
jgi:hypothetical protein